MIQSLQIQNFQSHKDSLLEFNPGVNVIVGASDSGKTAILRALRWVIWNRPNGDDFRSDWGGETNVQLFLNDGHKISRSKDKENLYEVDHGEWLKPKVLKAFSTKVPEEVQQILNIDNTNLQKQFDSPFLISSNPGEVARYFNKIAHLEKIDTANTYVKGKITTLTAKQKADTETRKEYQEELKQYEFIDKFEIDLEELEHQAGELTTLRGSRKRLNTVLGELSEVNTEITELSHTVGLKDSVDEILTMLKERKEAREEFLSLRTLIWGLEKNEEEAEALEAKTKLKAEVNTLLKLMKDRNELWKDKLKFFKDIKEIKEVKQKQLAWETTLGEKESLFHEHMPEICPLCSQKIS